MPLGLVAVAPCQLRAIWAACSAQAQLLPLVRGPFTAAGAPWLCCYLKTEELTGRERETQSQCRRDRRLLVKVPVTRGHRYHRPPGLVTALCLPGALRGNQQRRPEKGVRAFLKGLEGVPERKAGRRGGKEKE